MERMVDWRGTRRAWVRMLTARTGEGLGSWNRRIARRDPPDERSLRRWLAGKGVTGYAQTLLVMERFGYPDFLRATASELIDGQYRDRPRPRPVCDAVIAVTRRLGDITVQARKGYLSLVTPRRTFARIHATTTERVDVHLRIRGARAGGRLRASRLHEGMPVRLPLGSAGEIDGEAARWLRRAFEENR